MFRSTVLSLARLPTIRTAAALFAALAMAPLPARALAPGERITAANVASAKDLISPGLEWCIKRGFPLTVTGKVQKYRMREIAVEELGLQAAASERTA